MDKIMDLTETIKGLSEAPDGQIDKHSTALIKDYLEKGEITHEGNLRVLRNCLDACVAFAHGSNFATMFINTVLANFPVEPMDKMKDRQLAAYPDYFGSIYKKG